MRRILEIRALKSKPGFRDIILKFIEQKDEQDMVIRERMKNKVMQMYEKNVQ